MHEALIGSCSSSIQGYGAYAFASKSGVDILINDKEFDSLLDRGNYSMIVGVDEITNTQCLDRLSEINKTRPNFKVQAYCHNDKGSLFHPKISFFKNEEEKGTLIVGSGNLTLGGLRKNREAFGVIELSQDEYKRIELYWLAWLEESSSRIRELSDEEVVRKAKENIYVRKPNDNQTEMEKELGVASDDQSDISETVAEGWHYIADNKVLLAEIPKSGDRWKQANFDKHSFESFFGATPGDNSQRIILRGLNDDDSLSSIEVRPSVSVKSQNYRFELDAASGLLYPTQGKPVGIFIQLTMRMFLYHLYMPDHPLYSEISDWMNTNWKGRKDRMKRIESTAGDLESILSKSVFKQYKI